MSHSPFALGERYSSQRICDLAGGGNSQTYLLRLDGRIVAGRFDPKLNPNAPREVYAGHGPVIVESASLAVEQNSDFPVFLKRGNKDYEYVGRFSASEFSDEPEDIARAEAASNRHGRIAGVLKLKPVTQPQS